MNRNWEEILRSYAEGWRLNGIFVITLHPILMKRQFLLLIQVGNRLKGIVI